MAYDVDVSHQPAMHALTFAGYIVDMPVWAMPATLLPTTAVTRGIGCAMHSCAMITQHAAVSVLLQVTLATLSSLLREAQLVGQAGPRTHLLHILDPTALIPLLSKAFISNTEAAYGSRAAALHLLTSLISCVRSTWETTSVSLAGSEWDGAVVGCLGAVVRYVCMPNHDTRLGGFKGKQLLRQALACLLELVRAVPVRLWSEAWQQVGHPSPARRDT